MFKLSNTREDAAGQEPWERLQQESEADHQACRDSCQGSGPAPSTHSTGEDHIPHPRPLSTFGGSKHRVPVEWTPQATTQNIQNEGTTVTDDRHDLDTEVNNTL